MPGLKVASIDIGSNAMRLLVAQEQSGKLVGIDSDRASVRLGAEVFEHGYLSEITIEKALSAIRQFKTKIDAAQVHKFRAIGTSAMREAANSGILVSKAKELCNVDIEIIDGDEEARLVYLAVSESLNFSKGIDVLIDIGGGSVEVSIVKDGAILFSESVKLGTVRLIKLFGSGQITARTFERLVREYSKTIKVKIQEELGDQKVERCIGTGGNLETFLQLRQRFYNKNGNQLERNELESILENLQELSVEERIEKLGLRADRADVIVPAAIVMLHILRAADSNNLIVPGVGVKEGVAYELLQEVREDNPRFDCQKLRLSALALGQKYDFDQKHAECVASLALNIFEQTKSLHGLGQEGRKLLELAAILHDLGHFISSSAHHKHSFYLIESASLPGLTKREKIMLGCIARYHRKKFPQVYHDGYKELTAEERLIVNKLAAILRLAEGLDRERQQLVNNLQIEIPSEDSAGLKISIKLEGDLLLDSILLKRKADLFEHVFGLSVHVEIDK